MERVITYIDGFNLYFGMKSRFRNRYLWLNVEALSHSLLLPSQSLITTKYFTSRVANQPDKERRQKEYLEALQAGTSCQMFFGRYQSNTIECKGCGSVWPSPKEKMTDVNIATEMMIDAFSDAYDTALLISGDTDLIPPINAIRRHFPKKRIGVYFPPDRHALALQKVVNFSGLIGRSKLRDNQLPDTIIKPDGYVLNRPGIWI